LSIGYENNTTKLKEMAALMGETTFAKVKKLESAFEGFRIELGQLLVEMLMPMIQKVTNLLGEFGNLDKETQQLIITIGGFAALLGPVLIAIGGLVAVAGLAATGLAAIATAAGAVGSFLAANSALVLGITTFATAVGLMNANATDATAKAAEKARLDAIKSQKGFMLTTWDAYQALQAEADALKAVNKELNRQEAFQKQKDLDSGAIDKDRMQFGGMPSLSAMSSSGIATEVQGTLINTTDAMQQLVDNFDAKTQAVKDTLTGFALDVGFAFSDAFSSMAVSGQLSLQSLGNLFVDLLKMMAKMVIQALIMTAIFAALGVAPAGGAFAGQGMSSFKQTMLGMMGGGFANGGQPPLGKVSLVGEQGPELFVPSQKGTIIPNGGFGGGTTTPDVRITGDDLLIVFDRANRRKSRR